MNCSTKNHIYSIIFFFIVFSIYLFTLHPTVSPYRDSGDLVVAASTLGIAHPPGYPAYVLVGKVFETLIPWANTAYKMNILSALFGALAVLLLVKVINRIFNNNLILISSILILAFSTAFWRLSLVSEMYSINAFFAVLIIYLLTLIHTNNLKNVVYIFYVLSLVCGFAAGNHQTIIFVFPGILLLLWNSKKYKIEHYFTALGFFVLGLSVYLFLPIRSHANPISDWGSPKSLYGFWRIITRADYGGMRLHPEQSHFSWTIGVIFQHIYIYLKSLTSHFTIIGLILGIWGIFLERKNKFFHFLLISLIISGPGFIILSNLPPNEQTTLPILEPHLVLPCIFFILFIIASLSRIIKYPLGRILTIIFVLISFSSNISYSNYRNTFYAYDYGRNLLKTVEYKSIIYNPDDPTGFITTYLNTIEKKRQDIKLVAYFRTKWGYEQLKARHPEILPAREILSGRELERIVLDYNKDKYSIYSELPYKFPEGYSSYPKGLLYKLSKNKEFNPKDDPFIFYSLRDSYIQQERYDFFTNKIISYYSASHNNLGLAYCDLKNFARARRHYYQALGMEPDLLATYNNLGTLEYYQGRYPKAANWFKKVIQKDPKNASAYFNLGLTFKVQNDIQKAKDSFKTAWEKYSYPNAGNELGLIALNSKNYVEAVDIFKSILNKFPKYILAYYNVGLALSRLGRNEESIFYLKYYLNNISDQKEKEEVEKFINTLIK